LNLASVVKDGAADGRGGRPLLRVRGVSKRFANGTLAIHGVDLDLAVGEFVSLLGPSGCGKSTLLRIIAGLATPSAGALDWPSAPTPPQATPSPRSALSSRSRP
jgi:NitT/TauT family transport system ATP-binding protein